MDLDYSAYEENDYDEWWFNPDLDDKAWNSKDDKNEK